VVASRGKLGNLCKFLKKNLTIETLDVSQLVNSNNFFEFIKMLKFNKTIKNLTMNHFETDNEELISKFLELSSIETLIMEDSNLSGECMISLFKGLNFSTLKKFQFPSFFNFN
jgi:hypothetical protein